MNRKEQTILIALVIDGVLVGTKIVQPIERSEPQPLTLEQATPLIKDELTHRKHDELLAQASEQLQKEVGLVIYDSTLRALLAHTSAQATPIK